MVGLCRLCASLRKDDVLITIQDDSNEICEKLKNCFQWSITIRDALPKSICQECLDDLNMSHKFYLKVREAQETLQALYPLKSEGTKKDYTATLVKNLSVAGEEHWKRKSSLEHEQANEFANKKTTNTSELVKTIKLEVCPGIHNKNCNSSRLSSRKNSIQKLTSETIDPLEEVYNILEMTKEEVVLDNSYEILETLEETSDVEEIAANGESENTKYMDYENEGEEHSERASNGEGQKQSTEATNDLLEEDYNDNLDDSENFKERLDDSEADVSIGLNVEMEYIEDDECDEDHKNKLNKTKAHMFVSPELQFNSWKSYSFLCYLCDSETASFLDLKKHIAIQHNITENERIKYKCYDCQKTIPSYNFFLNHVRSKHHPALKLRCEACDLSCQTFEELSQHRSVNCEEAKNYVNIVPCNQCFKSFYNTFGLQNHQRFQHSDMELKLKYQCLQCKKQFQNKASYRAHERIHTDRNTYACEICQKIFTRKLCLKQHLHVHATHKNFICNICNKSFKSFSTLDQHQSLHNDEKPFKCEYCEKKFRKKIEKEVHERVHTGEMPFQCDQCDKRFRFRSAYYAHSKIHSGVKPYSCGYCDKMFAESSNRNKHVRRMHLNEQKKKKI